MFEVIIYLFETYIYSKMNRCIDENRLRSHLKEVGFYSEDVYNALKWLKQLSLYQKKIISPKLVSNCSVSKSIRIYVEEEKKILNTESQGFLLFLEQVNILDIETREMIIDRVMALDTKEFKLEDLKWLILMVLYNIPGYESTFQQLEQLIFDSKSNTIH
ncbi:hypothetical protein CRV11_02690 [Candidatus Pantoea edessiphila]|uniref:Protein Smg n=1 Tax=Candidatus Pantoea edessiphila TaxID=2044610 RepID=A0A2P5SY20_9GAMM|nr:DUF494 family protein [Candidatus Pantoea edessiphila]MBK4775905.1 DUF494 family protein [Pantoea sp. Edef]PPI87202.1 hypothetical protein CRV11_02690 [Candidatus Pantoea edessiphila]